MLLGGGRDLSPAPLPHFLPRATYNGGGGTPIASGTKLPVPPSPSPPCLLPTAPLDVGGSPHPPRPVLELPPQFGAAGGGILLHYTRECPPSPAPPRGAALPLPPLFIPLRLHLPCRLPFLPPPAPSPVPELPPLGGGPRSHVYSSPHPGGGRGFSIFAK